MTDDESYNAMSKALLIDMSLAQLQSGTLSLWEAYELAWLSSAKYHTKRERERCVLALRSRLGGGIAKDLLIQSLIETVGQEPKP